MDSTPAASSGTRPKFPMWLTVTLSGFAVLFVLGAVLGKSEPPAPQPVAAPVTAATTSTTATSSTTAAPTTYTVEKVTDGATVDLAGSDGSHRTVHLLGIVVATGNNCFAPETMTWASTKLAGVAVSITSETADGVALSLADGNDYATAALENGYAQLASTASDALRTAADSAQKAAVGLWAPPCKGVINAPTPTTPTPPPPPKTSTHVDPPPVKTEEPETKKPSAVYYKNCAAARAAGAAPLHVWDPGYRPALDRNRDGVACEE
ncbi:thermonuclease family protein [Amycolatopsis jejuensis]|uniref:thermonuclease family protein n=1 Tax=Amycolatopsis jejuensis TaxID=330084 RepID=UPI000525B0A5|nr:excalibur calcium-binding domain-containing protein [Amycolatopsis jejuensis]